MLMPIFTERIPFDRDENFSIISALALLHYVFAAVHARTQYKTFGNAFWSLECLSNYGN